MERAQSTDPPEGSTGAGSKSAIYEYREYVRRWLGRRCAAPVAVHTARGRPVLPDAARSVY